MSKTALRYLSLGFLLSAILLAGYRAFFFEPAMSAEGTDAPSTELSPEENTYKEKYEQLLAETEVAKMEHEQDSEDTSPSNTAESTESPDEDAGNEVITTTVVINEGEPSSVAAAQLQNQGILDNAGEFNDYLEENNLTTLIRPGSFTVSSDMSYGEIADTLLSKSN